MADAADMDVDANAERPESSSEEAWQKFKRQKRKLVAAWIHSRPACRLAVVKRGIRPTLAYLAKMLMRSGARWEQQQQHAAAFGERRSYPVLEAARGDDLEACMDDLYKGMHGDLEAVVF